MIKAEIQNIEPVKYMFSYKKHSYFKEKSISDFTSEGKFNLKMKNENDELELLFRNEYYSNNKSKNPLLFSPVKFIYDENTNSFLVKNKENIKMQWNKYKGKYRNSGNAAMILIVERLYFHMQFGLEYDFLSNGSYAPFFINIYKKPLIEDSIINGMGFILTPLSLPLKLEYIIEKKEDGYIFLNGVASLDEEKLEKLITNKNFQKNAKSYHFTKNFTIESDIQILYDTNTRYIYSSIFWLKILGKEEKIDDEIQFEIFQEGSINPLRFRSQATKMFSETKPYKNYKGKSYTESEWIAFEKELWQNYKKENNIVSQEDIKNKESKQNPLKKDLGFFLDEKEER